MVSSEQWKADLKQYFLEIAIKELHEEVEFGSQTQELKQRNDVKLAIFIDLMLCDHFSYLLEDNGSEVLHQVEMFVSVEVLQL